MKKIWMNRSCVTIAVFLIVLVSYSVPVKAEVINWRMSTVWSPGIPFIEADRKFVEIVNKIGTGRFQIKLFTSGEIVPAYQLFDTVTQGVVEIGSDWAGYWAGKNSAFSMLGSFPMLLMGVDYQNWIYQAGGLDLYNEVYGKFGLVYFPHACVFSESGIRGHKPIKTLADYKGLKLRMSGKPQGEILKRLGASQVMLAGGEVYQALEKGTVDGAEFSGPALDWPMGFAEVTEYWCTPGWHQPGSPIGIMINKKAWEKLPEDVKAVIEYAAMATYTWATSRLEYNNAQCTTKFLEKGIKVTRLSDKDLAKLEDMSMDVLKELCKENPLMAKIARSQINFLKTMSQWREISTPFSYGRNIPDLPDIE